MSVQWEPRVHGRLMLMQSQWWWRGHEGMTPPPLRATLTSSWTRPVSVPRAFFLTPKLSHVLWSQHSLSPCAHPVTLFVLAPFIPPPTSAFALPSNSQTKNKFFLQLKLGQSWQFTLCDTKSYEFFRNYEVGDGHHFNDPLCLQFHERLFPIVI